MTQHTPTPWEYDAMGKYYTPDGVIRVNGVVICRMTPSLVSVPIIEEIKANARLIAAAPDMLEALEECVPLLQHYFDIYGTSHPRNYEHVCLSIVLSAIKKARGEI